MPSYILLFSNFTLRNIYLLKVLCTTKVKRYERLRTIKVTFSLKLTISKHACTKSYKLYIETIFYIKLEAFKSLPKLCHTIEKPILPLQSLFWENILTTRFELLPYMFNGSPLQYNNCKVAGECLLHQKFHYSSVKKKHHSQFEYSNSAYV